MPSVEEALEFIKTNEIKWIGLNFVTVDGELKNRTMSAKDFGSDTFSNGLETNLSEIFGFSEKQLTLIPDPDSYARIPWEPNTMRFISNIYSTDKERFMYDSRYSIERVNINARAMGISDVQIGTETEYYLFDAVSGDKTIPERGPNYTIDTREAYWNPTPLWNSKNGAFANQPQDSFYAIRAQMAELMEDQFRYAIHSHSHGRSSNAQQKMKIRPYNVKIAADALITFKYIARNASFIANNIATFMPLPILGDKGSALSINQQLRKGIANLFYDENGEFGGLSQTALYYIGGILEHGEALSIFTSPTTNSYKKLRSDPHYIAWSKANQNALVNIEQKGEECSVVYTSADPSVNPYLAYTVTAAAGLDGIKNKIDPGKPIDENILEMDRKKMKESKIRTLPGSIIESISALESDNKFLKGFISSELLSQYLEQKIAEHRENEKRPTAFEIERYFNC
ncbi:MAG: glutamine synthetase family protein [Candidatus Micrarchaeota archaeon]